MAASALVAVPEPASSRPASEAGSIDPAQFRALSLALPAGPGTSTTRSTDTATRSAGWLGPDSAILEPGAAPTSPDDRPRVAQPASKVGTIAKNYWRFDPDISWYGPGLYGNGTACGQRFTKEIVGVAHRSLPCGTLVQFRYNGRVVTAPIIDRGPYVAGRTWDLSKGLCTLLDHCFTGTIEWRFAP